MSDIVDAGQTFNGHGRGMCQWGTQRWSINQGKDFVWIVNHYYNNNGAGTQLRVGALQSGANSVLPPPTLNAPGVDNLAPGSSVTTLPAGFLQMNAQYRWNMTSHNTAGYGSANTFRTYFQVAAAVTISGRIFAADGATGLRNAAVTLSDPQGGVRTATTSSFGFYSFDNVAAGGSYTIRVLSRRFRFSSQTVQPSGDLRNVDFVGLE